MITVFGVTGLPAVLGCIGSFVLAMLIYLIGCYGTYKANKLQLRENYIAITNGMFASSTQFIDYHKITIYRIAADSGRTPAASPARVRLYPRRSDE